MNTGGMSIRRKAKMSLIKTGIKIVILCIVLFWVFPNYIAPDLLGITPEFYAENTFVLNILAGAISAPIMWVSDRVIEFQMGK